MAKRMDPMLVEILTKYGERAEDAVWDCHGTWVAYHKAIERIAAKAGVEWTNLTVIEANSKDKIVAISVEGKLADKKEWSFGEAAPANNKNAYPYAMAEKRAKDRVVLKLIGLHGLLYSEEEADDFKESRPAPAKSSAQLKRDGVWEEFQRDMMDVKSTVALEKLRDEWREKAKVDGINKTFLAAMKDAFEGKAQELKANEADFPGDIPLTAAG